MPVTYATYSEFLFFYPNTKETEANITSAWLPYGAVRVNECLGDLFTAPFSVNNYTAKQLSIDFAYLGLLIRSRPGDDSVELKEALDGRIEKIRNQGVMIDDDGAKITTPETGLNEIWSNNQPYHPTFSMLENPEQELVDVDRIKDELDDRFP